MLGDDSGAMGVYAAPEFSDLLWIMVLCVRLAR